MKSGNDLWWDQVRDLQEEIGGHYKEVEVEVFKRIYERMRGMKQEEILKHFKETFNIGQSAFYARLRKVGQKYVIR